MSAQPCLGCGAPIDCPGTDDYTYTLTADPKLPYFFLCPTPYTCRPPSGSSQIYLDCCGHIISATVQSTTTDDQLAAIIQGMLAQCQQFAGECTNPPGFTGGFGPIPPIPPYQLYFNQPVQCAAGCPDGPDFFYTVPAGSTFATSQAEANAAAARICPRLARGYRLCIGSLFELGCGGQVILEDLTATSLHPPVAFAVTAGAVPTGTVFATVDPLTASLGGTLTTPGVFTFTVTATDAIGHSVSRSYTINVFGITNLTLPDGTVGTPYNEQLLAAGGTGTVVFSADPGDLPDGLAMDSSGLITGTPTTVGVTGFVVQITDSEDSTCDQTVTITVNAVGCIDWPNLGWQAATITGGGAGTATFSPDSANGDTFDAFVDAPDAENDTAHCDNSAFTFYSGLGCNANLHIEMTSIGTLNWTDGCSARVTVFCGGWLVQADFVVLGPGIYDFPFSLPNTGGVPTLFTIQVTASADNLFLSEHEQIHITGTLTTV